LSVNQSNTASTNHQQAANGQVAPTRAPTNARIDVQIKLANQKEEHKTHSVDVRVTHLDCSAYNKLGKSVDELLRRHTKEKRVLYERAVKAKGHVFEPFVVTTCGILSPPAEDFLSILASHYAEKRGLSLSLAKTLMRAQIGIAIIKGSSWGMFADRSEQAKEARRIREGERDIGPGEVEIRELFSNAVASQLPH
jgi:hypothetical protein